MSTHCGNQLLETLPDGDIRAVLAASELVHLSAGDVLFAENAPLDCVYFPTTAVCGVVITTQEGREVEVTTVGRDGLIGLPLFLAVEFHPFQAVVEVPGQGLRMAKEHFQRMTKDNVVLDRLLRRYVLYRLRCANQTGACNTLHGVQERMARWLLMSHDRVGRNEFPLTHEFLAELLGVRRQTVGVVAATLQQAGFITYRRGVLNVLERSGLEKTACECYKVLKTLYRRIVLEPIVIAATAGPLQV